MPIVTLNFGKTILQIFQMSCKICVCAFR